MTNYYADILLALANEDIKFVVGGGVACVLHGVERVTMDIDLALEMSEDNIRKFIEVAKTLNLQPRVPVPIEFIIDPENRKKIVEEKNALVFSVVDPTAPYKQIDIFLTENASYTSLINECDSIVLAGKEIQIASKQKLISMKKEVHPPRSKDQFDIEELLKLISKDSYNER